VAFRKDRRESTTAKNRNLNTRRRVTYRAACLHNMPQAISLTMPVR
jgi:hypothetical protein